MRSLPFLSTVAALALAGFAAHAHADEQTALPGGFASGLGTSWVLSTLEHTAATATSETGEGGKQAVHVIVPKAGEKRWYVQIVGKGISLRGGRTYHLHFRARSKPACEITVLAGSYHEKFTELWRQDHLALKDGWAEYTCDITPKEDEQAGQIIFGSLAAQAAEYWFADVSLTE